MSCTMFDRDRLALLVDLRKRARVSLRQMAAACGLYGDAGRESVRAWELGESKPQSTRRPKIVHYLWNDLGLHRQPELLTAVWGVFVDEWGWNDLTADEWHMLTITTLINDDAPRVTKARPNTHTTSINRELGFTFIGIPEPAPLPPGSRVPYQRNPKFVGRDEELRAIAAALIAGSTAAIAQSGTAAATGLGGIGKTQLAIEFVHRYGQFYPGGVFWLSFADAAAVAAEVAACGGPDHLALQADYGTLALEERVRLVRTAWERDEARLLVFDNCEAPDLLRRWRPQRGGCRVLLTSRRAAWEATSHVWTLPLPSLPRLQSLELLRRHCPDLSNDDPSLIAIAAELDDLPLALHLAGSFLARNRDRLAPEPYLNQLRTIDEDSTRGTYTLSLQHPSLSSGGVSPTGHDQHVARTFAISFDQLDPSDAIGRLAHDLLARAVSFAPGEPMPVDLLATTMATHASEQITQALTRLTDLGLLEPTGVHEQVRVHRLIAAYVQQVIPSESADTAQADVERTMVEAVAALNAMMDHTRVLALEVHLRAVTNQAVARHTERAADLCHELGDHLLELESFADAERYLSLAIQIREHERGKSHVTLAPSLHRLGWLYDAQGDSVRAVPYHRRGLALREVADGEYAQATAESLNYVGTVLHAVGAFTEAAQLYARALRVREQLLGEQHPETAQSLNNLGLLLIFLGRYDEAHPYLMRAVAIREQPPQIRPKLAIALNNLGYVLRKMARYTESRHYHEQARSIREAIYGPDHTYLAVSLNHLGRLFHAMGDYAAARPYLERALEIRRVLLPESGWLSNSLSNFGMLLLDLGDIDEALGYIEQGLAMNQRIWEDDHWHTARSLNHLGLLYSRAGELRLAQRQFEQALTIRTRILGPDHPDTANTLAHLGMSTHQQGRHGEAQHLVEQAVERHRRRLSPDHPYLARSRMFLGSVRSTLGKIENGKELVYQALVSYEHMLGTEHPFTKSCRTLLQTL